MLAIAGISAACAPAAPGASATAGPSAAPTLAAPATVRASATAVAPAQPGVITLVTPAAGAVIAQNDPALATRCAASATRGSGYVIDFSWTGPVDLARVDHFQVVMQHRTSTPIVLDLEAASRTSYSALSCNTFVIDNNLTGWHWQVNALDAGKQVVATSEQRPFTFGPCRLANGTTCNAPG